MLIKKSSVARTIDAINDGLFWGRELPAEERKQVAKWLAARQGLPGAYANTFAGFEAERKQGIRVFTGELMTCASARHILGEESMRALRLLEVGDDEVQAALARADKGQQRSLELASQDSRNTNCGWFCCGKCTVAVWRNLLSGGLNRQSERLADGVKKLNAMRDGKGGWRRFPFWYTVLALNEIKTPEAKAELRYAKAKLQGAAKRKAGSNTTAQRRSALAQRTLAQL
jgi:hypothetical protein